MSDSRPVQDDELRAGGDTIRRVKEGTPAHLQQLLDEQLANLPRSYFNTVSYADIHNDLLFLQSPGSEPQIAVYGTACLGVKVLLKQHFPNVFLFVAGAVAKQSLGIGRASIFSGFSQPILLSYYDFSGEVAPELAQKVARDIRKSMQSGMPCMPLLYRPDNTAFEVLCDNAAAEHATVLRVKGRDQIGFLFRVAAVLSELKLNVLSADIHTAGVVAENRYNLTSASGAKLGTAECDVLKQKIWKAFTP